MVLSGSLVHWAIRGSRIVAFLGHLVEQVGFSVLFGWVVGHVGVSWW